MLDSKIFSLIPKTFFPKIIINNKWCQLLLNSISSKKIFLLISPSVKKNHGEKLDILFQKNFVTFFEINNEPTKKESDELINKFSENNYDLIMGIGGGSIMDLSKIIKMKFNKELILIPTTFGSGSEISQFSLLINEKKQKEVISSYNLLPDIILLDPSYLTSLSRENIAYSIVDALAHAIEGLVSKGSNPLSDIFATKAIDIILENAEKAYNDQSEESLEQLQIAGLIAGIVQSTASVGLIHSIAHVIGPKYNLSHGKAISLKFIDVLKFNKTKTMLYNKLNSCKHINSSNFISKIEILFIILNISLGEKIEYDSEEIIKNICTKTNPYYPTIEDINRIMSNYFK